VHYSLVQRSGKVALVQRGKNESLMAGMWELPTTHVNGEAPLLTLKHSITNTDYTVRVYAAARDVVPVSAEQGRDGAADWQWFRARELSQLPLTGLALKILRRTAIIQ
jgi:A/G-specific adenine glycosylase